MQLLALVLDLSAGCNKQRGKSGASGVQRNIELGGIHIPLNVAIGISMSVALLNLIKTIVILKFESMSVDLSLWEYIKCALLRGRCPCTGASAARHLAL